jgi:hypothetical protein
VLTGIFKEPVAGRVALRRLNLEGDEQADLKVHGGPQKAVYVYPANYYAFWSEQFPEMELPCGMFGENLTISGMRDDTVYIGDQFRPGRWGGTAYRHDGPAPGRAGEGKLLYESKQEDTYEQRATLPFWYPGGNRSR